MSPEVQRRDQDLFDVGAEAGAGDRANEDRLRSAPSLTRPVLPVARVREPLPSRFQWTICVSMRSLAAVGVSGLEK